MGWRITIDRDLCQGHGMCEVEAPETFTLSKDGTLAIHDEHPSGEALEPVREAVRYCPVRALSLTETSGG
ncbi:ferredoxin [Actinocorallia populi]|uniref:ferredoxin n=1 Tax=Actinocorallia populi TaxID=2079200 RepID=UPI000D08FE19|nr:ferredoxin [Actinocorallia populi]